MAAQPLLKAGLRKTIGTGQTTLVWVDPWIPTSPARPAIPCGSSFNPSLRVSDLCDVTTKEWNDELLQELIAPNDIPLIRSLKLMSSSRNIGYCWNLTATGVYSVKTGYALAMELSEPPNSQQVHEPSIKALQAKVWKIKTSKKISTSSGNLSQAASRYATRSWNATVVPIDTALAVDQKKKRPIICSSSVHHRSKLGL